MIFVTVGTTYFDDLIEEVDRLVKTGEIDDDVFAQIGQGQYVPANIKWTNYLSDIYSYYDQADLVICHGGTGTVLELLTRSKDFIAVSNRELPCDHQADFLKALELRDYCACCYDVSELAKMLKEQ